MAINLWDPENLKTLMRGCKNELLELGLPQLFANYTAVKRAKKELDVKELDYFKAIISLLWGSSSKPPEEKTQARCGEWGAKVERKFNTKVDHKKVEELLKSDNLSPETNFGLLPFRVKFDIDKKVMDQLREQEPEYYLTMIAPLLETSPGKPGLAVEFVGEGKL